MAKKATKTNAKQQAYAKKQEQQGMKTVMWIIGSLIILGLVYALYASLLVA